jgi:hypothetical protein
MILVTSHPHQRLFRSQLCWPLRLLNTSLVLPQAKARGTFRIPHSPSVVRALMGCMNCNQVDVCLYFLHRESFYATHLASIRIYPYSGLCKCHLIFVLFCTFFEYKDEIIGLSFVIYKFDALFLYFLSIYLNRLWNLVIVAGLFCMSVHCLDVSQGVLYF